VGETSTKAIAVPASMPPPPPTTAPPAVWETAASGPPLTPHQRPAPPRPWRERLPELAGTVGTILVLTAAVALITTTWSQLSRSAQGILLVALGAALTAAALYAETGRNGVARAGSLVLASATALVGVGVTMLALGVLPGRLAIATGGLLGAAHAAWGWRRQPDAGVRAGAFAAALLYAAGPGGSGLADQWDTSHATLTDPLYGLFDVAYRTDQFWLPSAGWFLTGVVLLVVSAGLRGRARNAATAAATFALFGAALMLNIATAPIGAFAALVIVGGYLTYGLVSNRRGVVGAGIVATVFVALRVLTALFTGQLAVIVAAIVTGTALLVWSVTTTRRGAQSADGRSARHDEV